MRVVLCWVALVAAACPTAAETAAPADAVHGAAGPLVPGIVLHGTLGPMPLPEACVIVSARALDGPEARLERKWRETRVGDSTCRPATTLPLSSSHPPPTGLRTPHLPTELRQISTSVCPGDTSFVLELETAGPQEALEAPPGCPTPVLVTARPVGRPAPTATRLLAVHGHVHSFDLDVSGDGAATLPEAVTAGGLPAVPRAVPVPAPPVSLPHLGAAAFAGGVAVALLQSLACALTSVRRRSAAGGRTASSAARGKTAPALVWERGGNARLVKRSSDDDAGNRGSDWERVPPVATAAGE